MHTSAASRLLIPGTALFWGLQFAFLNPVIALLLVALYGATPGDVGWALAVYNAGGFIAALVIPGWADRTRDYLRPLLACGVLTLALAGALLAVSTLPLAAIALIVLGGPASVGVSLLYAELRHSGATPRDVIRTRAIVSFAWVAGPPIATLIIGAWGERFILVVLAALAILNIATTTALIRRRRRAGAEAGEASGASKHPEPHVPVSRWAIVTLVLGFTVLQATNSAAVAVMSLFVTEQLGIPLLWAGIALGVAALLEIPALLAVGALSERFPSRVLVTSGCLAGVAYYVVMAFTTGPIVLLTAQLLNAWFFAVVAGLGLTLFQEAIPRPGLASGLFLNTRRIGAIVSGGIIALAATPLGYHGVFLACAVITAVALPVLVARRRSPVPSAEPASS